MGGQLGAPYAATAHSFLFRVVDPAPSPLPAVTGTGSRPLLINPHACCLPALPFPFVIVPWRLFLIFAILHSPALHH